MMSRRAKPKATRPPPVLTEAAGGRPAHALWWCGVLMVALPTGCASRHEQLVAFLRPDEAAVSTGHYTVNPPDSIAIHAPGAAEIDGVVQRVRPDGKVALRLLGEVHLAGLTTQEIAEKLKTALSRYYIEPEVVVEVNNYRSQHYYVFGEVMRPGPKPYTGRDTLLRALAEAIPTFLAWRSQIRVVRPAPDEDTTKTIVIDLDKMIRTGGQGENVLLQPGDIIEVPPTPLAWIGHRVRELLYPMEPAIEAYTGPAQVIRANETYQGQTDDDDDDRWFDR
jgi:polysaccharide export outer membrane protein